MKRLTKAEENALYNAVESRLETLKEEVGEGSDDALSEHAALLSVLRKMGYRTAGYELETE